MPAVLGDQLLVTLADGRTVRHVNLDYAATAPCLTEAYAAVEEILPWYASVHRGAGFLAIEHGIGVRDGLFCAHPLSRRLLAAASARVGMPPGDTAVRASVGIGSTIEHIDRLLVGLEQLISARRSASASAVAV